jgi:hypothetical protein
MVTMGGTDLALTWAAEFFLTLYEFVTYILLPISDFALTEYK